MRCGLLLVALLGLTWGNRLAAQEAPRKPQGLGQLVVIDPQSGSPVRLNLARYHVNIVLHPPVALVQIDQSFFNPFATQQEGTFVFNLPAGASVSRFAMYTTPTQLIEGELLERKNASSIYQSIVTRRRDPAILEQIGGNLFKMRVFPIFARDTKRILLDFTLPIAEQEGGFYTFELPLMSDLEPVWDFAVQGTIRGPNVAGTARCDSHDDVKFVDAGDDSLKFRFAAQKYRPESAFSLKFQQRQSDAVVIRSYTPAPIGGGVPAVVQPDKIKTPPATQFLATVSPAALEPIARAAAAKSAPADVLILADTSGGTTAHGRLRQGIRAICGDLRDEDRFALGCVDVDFRPLTRGWVAPRSQAADQALADFNREVFLGATDLVQSFKSALKSLPPAEPGRRRLIVYVGDGELAVKGPSMLFVQQAIADGLLQAGVRFSVVLHRGGQTAGAALEKPIAATGGRLLQIDAGGSFAELSEWVRAGCPDAVKIISVQAAGVDDDDLFAPPTWVPGHSLPVYGRRVGAGPLKLHVTLERDGQPEAHFWQLDLKDDPDDMFVGRLWAQLKLDQLQARELQREQRAFWEQSLEPQIIALSQEWTLLTPQTAFLVLENEDEYPRYGIVRRIRHTYWKPEDSLRATPLPREVLTALRQPMQASQTATRDQFTNTLLSACKALDDHAPRRALNLLARVANSDLARDSREFTALREAAASQIARQGVLREIGPNRGWFDRSQSIGFDIPVRDLAWRLVQGYGTSRAGDDPRLASLEKEVTPPQLPTSIEEFADWIEAVSGLDVVLDGARLQQDGVALDAKHSLRGIRSMSLENLLKHRLEPQQLAHVFEDGVLKITTAAHAADKLTTRLYPIGDIIQSTLATDYSLLASDSLDRELMAHRRLEKSLDRKVSVDFDKLPLDAVLQFLSDSFRDNMIIDRVHLGEDGIPLDKPVTLQRRDAPLRQILAQIFEQHGLAMSIESEAVIITTQGHAADRLITRLHSAQGIVYELPSDLMKALPQKPAFRGMAMGGMGMGMGGMGGAGGGGGGGSGGEFIFGGSGMGGFVGGGGAGSGFAGGGSSGRSSVSQSAAVSEFSQAGDLIADGDEEDPDPAQLPEVPRGGVDDEFEMSTVWKLQQSPGGFALPQPARHVNDMGMMNLISTSIQPDSWEELSGPGSMIYYPGALSFTIRQTSAIHAEIDELLDHLREMPPMFGPASGYRPARIPAVGPNDPSHWDLTSLMNMISLVIKPDSWEELSGPGAIVPHRLKLALSIRQTQAIHHELRDFFTALRRARYQARLGKTWKSFDLAQGPPFGTITGLTDLPAGTPSSEAAELDAAKIEALSVLQDPLPGTYVWRSSSHKSGASRMTTVRLGTARNEFEFDGRLIRTAGDEAAVVYSGIALVERGNWGSAARRLVDGRLPWMPHRSTRELARLFEVRTAAADKKTVQLRLALPDTATAGEILVTVSRELRLPIAWEARIGGHTMLRLRFENRHEQAGRSLWRTVIAEDEVHREVERWELVSIAELKADVPPLDAGWGDLVVVDLRDQERPVQPAALKALQAIRNGDWKGAERALDQALEVQPGQPLLEFARVWALRQSSETNSAVLVKALRRLAARATPDFFALLAERPFEGIDDGTFYEILQLQPPAARRLVNLDNLARVAVRAGRPREAIELLSAAVAQPDPSQAKGERVLRLVELLLETRRVNEAVAAAESRAAQHAVSPDELAALAEALHKGGAPATATKLMRAALADPQSTGEGRHRLLLKRASLEKDQVRWRTIVEAINELPESSPLRTSSIDLLLGELTEKSQADAVGQLVEIARHPRLRTMLMLRQAELFVEASNSETAARLGWELYLEKRLPADQLDWLFERLFAAKHHSKLVRLAEERLHGGHPLSQVQLDWLAETYDDLGLAVAARRARTNSSEIEPPAPKPEPPTRPRTRTGR